MYTSSILQLAISLTTSFCVLHFTQSFSSSFLSPHASFTSHHGIETSRSRQRHVDVLSSSSESQTDTPLEVTVSTSPFEPQSHDELMYCLGVNLARQLGDIRPLVENGDELAKVAKGLLDTVVGRLTEDGQRELLKTRGKDLNTLITERADSLRRRIEESGRAMLKEMSETEGAETLPSGVVVHTLDRASPDDNERPTAASTVAVRYQGTLSDGTIFDASPGEEPVTFALGRVIPGWKEALQKMTVGDTAMIGVPPELGYGMEGTPDGRIPGGATLFFKVTLVKVLTAGVGGGPKLVGRDGKALGSSGSVSSGGLLGLDGKPLLG